VTEALVIAPLLVPLVSLVLCLALANSRRVTEWISITAAVLMLAAASGLLAVIDKEGTLTLRAGGWAPPYGIVLVADTLSALMLWISAFTALAVLIYGVCREGGERSPGHLYVLIHGLMLGVNGSFLTGDLFNLYVWFEVMLISSFILMVREGKASQLPGGFTYVLLNLLASSLFLCGAGLLYGKLGTLNMADMAVKVGSLDDPVLVMASGAFIFIAFAAKAAVFPFQFWLPASYHNAGPAVSALFAGLLTKVGVYTLLRMFTLVFTPANGFPGELILWLSIVTMVVGVLGAVAQYHIRRLLAFHIISQIGYMTAGLGLGGRLALAAVIFYILHHIAVKSALFLVGGVLEQKTGTADIRHHGGFYKNKPLLAACFLIPAFSLAALGVGILTLFSMIKIWNESFWKKSPTEGFPLGAPVPRRRYVSLLVFCALTLVFSLAGGFVFQLADRAAGELMNPAGYCDAVLKGGTP
jgi:multicomponent Na+:H+ antiporter subunit D